MAQDITINSFEGGLNKDVALVSLPSNQYDEANDVEFISDETGKLTTLEAKKGTGLAKVTVPNATPQNQIWRIRTYADTAQTSTDYFVKQEFFLDYLDGTAPLVITYINGNPSITNAGYATDLTALLVSPYAGTVADNGNNNLLYTTLTFTTTNVKKMTRVTTFSGGNVVTDSPILIQEKITTETQLEPIAYVNSQNLGFVLSVSDDNTITELGVANEDNNWAYTRLLRTKSFVVSKTQPIKFIVEQQNDGVYALYFTDNTIKDKCIYVPPILTQDCCLAYSPTNIQVAGKGIYNLAQTDAQTNSQLVNNIGYVTYKNTLQSGGGLLTGGKRYVCRFGINGSNITTQWSILSNIVPVIAASADSGLAWVDTQGTPSGTPTSKQNILTINNAQSDIFNFVELGVVNYAGENATSGELIGRFDVLGESFDITHSGLERTTLLDVVSLIEAEPIILKTRDIETKKNRLNRANVVTANEDAKWQTIAENATVGTQRFSDGLSNTGALPSDNGNVRFKGKYTTAIFALTAPPLIQTLTFTQLATTPPTTSPSTYSSGQYICMAQDAPNLQINVSVNGTITQSSNDLYNMYFIVKKNGVEVGSSLIQGRFSTVSININYNNNIVVEVATGEVLEFCVQLHASNTAVVFNPINEGIVLNINNIASQAVIQFQGTKVGEYQIPFNVANRAGYMLYEYYMTYVRFHLKNGYITAPYPLGKYYLDTVNFKRGLVQILPVDPKTPFTDDSGVTASRKVYNYALRVSGLDLTNVKNELLGVSFERSEPLNTVIGSGIYHNARVIEGDNYTSGIGTGTVLSIADNRRKFGVFISNDLDNQVIKYSKGDYLKLSGIPLDYVYNSNYKSGTDKIGVVTELLGSVYTNNANAMIQSDWDIEDSTSVDFNSVGDIIYNTFSDLYYKPSTSTLNNAYTNSKCIAVATKGFVRNNGGTQDGINTYVAFYIRPIDLKAVDYKNYKPIPTGEIIRIDSSSPDILPATTVYGGDTYTQKVVRKAADWYVRPDDSKIISTIVTFYAQNRLNSQLFYTDTTAPKGTWNLQGSKSLYEYLFPFALISELVDEQHNFDKSYIGANQVNRVTPYNPLLPYPTSNPTRIYYSDEKAVGSLYDAYRKVKPLNFVDLELQNGAISAIYDIRDVMVVIQPTFVGAIPYAADTLIQSDSTAKILVGSGTVYSNRVYPLSSFGTSIKTMSCKGYNSNGNPQVYWMSDDFANFNRYDYSGVKILSSDNNMRTWFLNNTKHIKNEFDVNIYYNTKKEDVVMTARAVKALPAWNPATTYAPSTQVVFGSAGNWQDWNFEQIPSVYISTAQAGNTNKIPYGNTTFWTPIEPTDSNYYNLWSLIFNEKRNNFTTFMTPLQKRYFKHNNLVLTPRGVDAKGLIYQMDNVEGNFLEWFQASVTPAFKQGEFILSTVFNKFGTDRKMINVNFERGDDAAVQPDSVKAITPTQNVTLPINGTRLGVTYYPSYYDSNGDTPYGQFIKILISKRSYLKIRTIAMKFKNKFPLRMK